MAGKRPKQGWVYWINPYRVSLRCHSDHTHFYDLIEPGKVICKTRDCDLEINSSRVFRGKHPYLVWSSDEFQEETGYIQTFIAIPLTSQTTFLGLPTTYPIVNNSRNGLTKKSYALVHQLHTIDGNCFKNSDGDWLERIGQLEAKDRQEIEERLRYVLNLSTEPTDDWFKQNASPELLKKLHGYLSEDLKLEFVEDLLDSLD